MLVSRPMRLYIPDKGRRLSMAQRGFLAVSRGNYLNALITAVYNKLMRLRRIRPHTRFHYTPTGSYTNTREKAWRCLSAGPRRCLASTLSPWPTFSSGWLIRAVTISQRRISELWNLKRIVVSPATVQALVKWRTWRRTATTPSDTWERARTVPTCILGSCLWRPPEKTQISLNLVICQFQLKSHVFYNVIYFE